jgi:hypothetical protein
MKVGQKVKVECDCGGIKTYTKQVICEINNKGIYLDNGEGNKPSGPFDKKNLDLILLRGMGFGTQKIIPIVKK